MKKREEESLFLKSLMLFSGCGVVLFFLCMLMAQDLGYFMNSFLFMIISFFLFFVSMFKLSINDK